MPFNAIVLGLGHIRALGDERGTVGSGADKMDLVQMMLDCAETMTSVLDDVTDMGKFVCSWHCDIEIDIMLCNVMAWTELFIH